MGKTTGATMTIVITGGVIVSVIVSYLILSCFNDEDDIDPLDGAFKNDV
jgi:hypothetical protein